VTEGEPLTQVHLPGVQPLHHNVSKKVGRANRSKLFRETNNDGLFNTQNAKRFDLLIERL
jgi:hypothetical protein